MFNSLVVEAPTLPPLLPSTGWLGGDSAFTVSDSYSLPGNGSRIFSVGSFSRASLCACSTVMKWSRMFLAVYVVKLILSIWPSSRPLSSSLRFGRCTASRWDWKLALAHPSSQNTVGMRCSFRHSRHMTGSSNRFEEDGTSSGSRPDSRA